MTEVQRYRKILLAIQDKLKGLGSSNRNRWAAFCYEKSMPIESFIDKMSKYNLPYTEEELRTIWTSVGITSNDMVFQDFLKLMQCDIDEFVPVKPAPRASAGGYGGYDAAPAEPDYGSRPSYGGGSDYGAPRGGYDDAPRGGYGGASDYGAPRGGYGGADYGAPRGGYGGASDYGAPRGGYDAPAPRGGGAGAEALVHESLRDIISACMNSDSLMMGEISQSGFASICSRFGVSEMSPGWRSLVQIGDPTGSGLIRYFALADKVCMTGGGAGAGASSGFGGGYGGYDAPPSRGGYDAPPIRGGYDAPPSRGGYDAPSMRGGFDAPPSRGGYDAPPSRGGVSFGDNPARGGSSGGFDDYGSKPRSSGGNLNTIQNEIAIKVTDAIGNSKHAFQKWRGYSDKLSADAFQQGLMRDCHYNVDINDLRQIMSQYHDPLGLTDFVRLMGDGQDMAPAKNLNGSRVGSSGSGGRMTEDDQTISDIASQVRGQNYQDAIMKANSTEDVMRAFSRMGIRADEDKLRRVLAKMGKTGLIDSIDIKLGN